MNKFFHIELDDYAKPSIVSFGKSYFGTMDDIEEFISKFDDEDDNELVKAFEEYKNGNEDVEITVAFNKRRMIEEVKVYASRISDKIYKDKTPGEISNIYKDGIGVATKDGEIVILELKQFGKRRMNAKDYLNGIDKSKLLGKILK